MPPRKSPFLHYENTIRVLCALVAGDPLRDSDLKARVKAWGNEEPLPKGMLHKLARAEQPLITQLVDDTEPEGPSHSEPQWMITMEGARTLREFLQAVDSIRPSPTSSHINRDVEIFLGHGFGPWLILANIVKAEIAPTVSELARATGLNRITVADHIDDNLLVAGVIEEAREKAMVDGRRRDAYVATRAGVESFETFALRFRTMTSEAEAVFGEAGLRATGPEEKFQTSRRNQMWSVRNLANMALMVNPSRKSLQMLAEGHPRNGTLHWLQRMASWGYVSYDKQSGEKSGLRFPYKPTGRGLTSAAQSTLRQLMLANDYIKSVTPQELRTFRPYHQPRSLQESPDMIRLLLASTISEGYRAIDVAEDFGVPKAVVTHATRDLLSVGAVEEVRGEHRRFRITNSGRELLTDRITSSLPMLVECGKAFTPLMSRLGHPAAPAMALATQLAEKNCKALGLQLTPITVPPTRSRLQPEGPLTVSARGADKPAGEQPRPTFGLDSGGPCF